ncbi:MAG: iron ABC transporter substrate-binding protein [Rhodobiaceae bacterium]|nr:iron ABC transporter substrate-binding protein [Rhodobiaceae bacterium]MCC0048443.1 iron ABC transporter substrate-binding protein [Rhodobiaceae bacterium]
MRHVIASTIMLLGLFGAMPLRAGEFTDSAGRKVNVPQEVAKVFASGPPASVLVYVLKPDALTGWPRSLRENEKPYIAPAQRELPELGRLTGRGDTANLEVVLKTAPDLIIDFGSVRDTYISLADIVQTRTSIPYILIDGRFEATATALRLVGDALGVPERGEKLAEYTETLFADLDAALATIPEGQRPRVYLARGPDGLETGLKGSINTEIIERAGGRNVADPGDADVRRGIVQASMEQVLAANPDTIITWDSTFFEKVWSDPLWAKVDAVQKGRVYLSPLLPFGWIDRPPSLNRLIGLRWLAGIFFPEQFNQDLRAQVRSFYSLFYHVDLDEAALDTLLAGARGGRPQ